MKSALRSFRDMTSTQIQTRRSRRGGDAKLTLTVVLIASHPTINDRRQINPRKFLLPTELRSRGGEARMVLASPWSNISPSGPAIPVRRACLLYVPNNTSAHLSWRTPYQNETHAYPSIASKL